jgi:hypothetical protein
MSCVDCTPGRRRKTLPTIRRVGETQRHQGCNFMGMTPQSSEPPDAALEKMIKQHCEALGRIRACLDWAIQQTCASWKAKHKGRQLTEVNPNVLAGDIRQDTFFRYNDAYPPISSRVRRGANCSIAMVGNGNDAPIRKHPRNRYGFLLSVSSYPSDTLFGEDFTTRWSPYVLWEIDLEGQTLRDAWLAAVGDMDKKPKIWCSKPLPPAVLPPVRSADEPSSDRPDDGWDEWWENKGSGDEPA